VGAGVDAGFKLANCAGEHFGETPEEGDDALFSMD
jgi:hypothetical protein